MAVESEMVREDEISELIRSSIYREEPLAQKPDEQRGETRAQVHARVAIKVLEPDESVRFAALPERWGPFGALFGDRVFLLTDRAIVVTKVPVIPIAFLSRAKRYAYGQIESVSVRETRFFGKASELSVEFRDGWSEAFLLSPRGKAEEGATLIQRHLSPA